MKRLRDKDSLAREAAAVVRDRARRDAFEKRIEEAMDRWHGQVEANLGQNAGESVYAEQAGAMLGHCANRVLARYGALLL